MPKIDFLIFISFLVFVRLSELVVAKRNEAWIRKQGAVEYGKEHYPFMIALHTLFIVSIIIEYLLRITEIDYIFLALFLILISLKIIVISTLGKYWNTKILRIPNLNLVSRGIYRYIKHPNYVIVVLEIICIPMIFHLYYTALIFSLLNAAMLYVRISVENKALN
ncbi:MAG: isoprenylcysteine carboxylmethyltransferase family protein [Bacteroidota bacterium]|nr:isoprenylcysteine carboxylmethyltransferase family protein [Bacteroidota bacterium]